AGWRGCQRDECRTSNAQSAREKTDAENPALHRTPPLELECERIPRKSSQGSRSAVRCPLGLRTLGDPPVLSARPGGNSAIITRDQEIRRKPSGSWTHDLLLRAVKDAAK